MFTSTPDPGGADLAGQRELVEGAFGQEGMSTQSSMLVNRSTIAASAVVISGNFSRAPAAAERLSSAQVLCTIASKRNTRRRRRGPLSRLAELLDDAPSREQMGATDRERIESRLSWSGSEPPYVAVFDRVCGRATVRR